MQETSLLQQIADNWMVVAMFSCFVLIIIFAFLPSQSAAREDASMIPFRNDTPTPSDEKEA